MKKLLFILLFILTAQINAQWSNNTEIDPFDGKQTTVIGRGYGGSFPYDKPYLVFRKTGDKIETYVSGAGSLACDNAFIQFSYGDPDEIIEFKLSGSVGGDAGFFKSGNPGDYIDFIHLLKEKSILYVRFQTRCSFSNFKIKLNGSSANLNKIFGSKWEKEMQVILETRKKNLELRRQKEDKISKIVDQSMINIQQSLDSLGLTDTHITLGDLEDWKTKASAYANFRGVVVGFRFERHRFDKTAFVPIMKFKNGQEFRGDPTYIINPPFIKDLYKSAYYNGEAGEAYGLNDRNFKYPNRNSFVKCDEKGRVVVRIEVNQYGAVVNTTAGVKGTTNSHPCLLKDAERMASKSVFDIANHAPNRQVGFLVYDFGVITKIEDIEIETGVADIDVPFSVIEEVPVFPGCENVMKSEKRGCFQEQMNSHIRKYFFYPPDAQEAGIQGRVYVNFIIEKNGSIGEMRVRGPHKSLEDAALVIVSNLPVMTPGKIKGKAVRVPFSIPITYRLD